MRGRAIPLSRPRRLIGDLTYFAARVPTVPVQRRMNLASVIAARRSCQRRPPWTAIFTRAMALVAAEFAPLRRAYCQFPWPHLYEYPVSVASIMVERQYHGEPAALALLIKDPAGMSLAQLAAEIRHARQAPLESIVSFKRALSLAGWPRPLRRLAWWAGLNVGPLRGHYFGTFGVSVYSALGAESLHPLSPLTSTLNYGVFGDDGQTDVRLIYDHRVLDGATVARALVRLEEILNTAICDELRSPPPTARVSKAA